MAIQTVNLGTAPTGAGGDTFRSTGAKINENFTNPTHAASRYVGLSDGNLVEKQNICYAALTARPVSLGSTNSLNGLTAGDCVFCDKDVGKPVNSPSYLYSAVFTKNLDPQGIAGRVQTAFDYIESNQAFRVMGVAGSWKPWAYIYTTNNTVVDGNGFIKSASPIVQLFADKITANDEAKLQEITFEKLGVGDYLVKGSLGFAQEGWYVETPKDANGNVLFSVLYETLENGDISFKTYKKKFDLETASIVADLEKPVDITTGRWIDIRLQQLPQPEINHEDLVFESATPPDFQPTNLAQAVAEAFSNGTEQ